MKLTLQLFIALTAPLLAPLAALHAAETGSSVQSASPILIRDMPSIDRYLGSRLIVKLSH
jgi:hypothetical protein